MRVGMRCSPPVTVRLTGSGMQNSMVSGTYARSAGRVASFLVLSCKSSKVVSASRGRSLMRKVRAACSAVCSPSTRAGRTAVTVVRRRRARSSERRVRRASDSGSGRATPVFSNQVDSAGRSRSRTLRCSSTGSHQMTWEVPVPSWPGEVTVSRVAEASAWTRSPPVPVTSATTWSSSWALMVDPSPETNELTVSISAVTRAGSLFSRLKRWNCRASQDRCSVTRVVSMPSSSVSGVRRRSSSNSRTLCASSGSALASVVVTASVQAGPPTPGSWLSASMSVLRRAPGRSGKVECSSIPGTVTLRRSARAETSWGAVTARRKTGMTWANGETPRDLTPTGVPPRRSSSRSSNWVERRARTVWCSPAVSRSVSRRATAGAASHSVSAVRTVRSLSGAGSGSSVTETPRALRLVRMRRQSGGRSSTG